MPDHSPSRSPLTPTTVSFPSGAVTGDATVLVVADSADGVIVIVDSTPFHPVDHTWPDQPGDSGWLRLGEESLEVVEAVMAAISDEGDLAIGAAIPVKRGAEGWTWLVGHRLQATTAPAGLVADARVRLDIDRARRSALSRGHTACHLASLALDRVLADLWRKDPGTDALGAPDFEGRANQSSRIGPDGSVDEYRLGKSLRRAGFDTETFAAQLAVREEAITAQLAAWVAAGGPSAVETDGDTIVDRRRWRCALPEGEAVIPCGGTHVEDLAAFRAIDVSLALSDPQTLVMTTVVTPVAD